ncbi:unnamed protein product, partial [Effrenium voratum]
EAVYAELQAKNGDVQAASVLMECMLQVAQKKSEDPPISKKPEPVAPQSDDQHETAEEEDKEMDNA